MDKDSLKRLIDVANGKKKAELVIKNGSIVDVCSGKVFKADLAIAEGYIAGFGEYEGEKEIAAAKEEIRQLQDDYNNLKLAKMIEISNSDLQGAKTKMASLIRRIDKCIALLNG